MLNFNSVYTFQNAGSGKMLNLYGSASDGKNVVQYTADGSDEQRWKYTGNKLLTMRNTNFALDRYRGSGSYNNADVWTESSSENSDQCVYIRGYSDGTCHIVLASTLGDQDELRLTAYGSGNGTASGKSSTSNGNVFWAAPTYDDYQNWYYTEEGSSSGGETPEPSTNPLTNDVKIASSKYHYYCQQTYDWDDGNYGISKKDFQQTACAVLSETFVSQIEENNPSITAEDCFRWGLAKNSDNFPYATWNTSNEAFHFTFQKVATSNEETKAMKTAFEQIVAGKPVVFGVYKGSNFHYVVGYGLKKGCSIDTVQRSDIYVLDPWTESNRTLADTMNYSNGRWSNFYSLRITASK